MGRDHTLFALEHGAVKFTTKRNNRTYVNIEPMPVAEAAE
jgi:large subunit ribosomal protein L27